MSRKIMVVVVAVALVAFGTTLVAAKTLRFQSAYPRTAYAGQSALYFAAQVAKLTKGQVKVKVFWPGQVVKTREAFDAVRKGMIDGYSGSLLYFAGLVPEVNCQWLPFNWADPAEAKTVLLKKGYLKVMAAAVAKHGVTYLAPVSVASMGLLTKFPVKTLADLHGKKIRAVGMEAHIVRALGAAAVAIAGAEQYMALQRGTVDGTDYPWYTIEKYKFYEVLKYIIRPAFHTPGLIELVINTKVLMGLPQAHQAAIKKAALMAMERSLDLTPKWDAYALKRAGVRGVKVLTLSAAEQAKFHKALMPLYDKMAKRSPACAKLVAILKAHLKSKGVKF